MENLQIEQNLFSIGMHSIVQVELGTSGNFIVESDVKALFIEYVFKFEIKENIVDGFGFDNFKVRRILESNSRESISIPINISMDSGEKFNTNLELDFSKAYQIVSTHFNGLTAAARWWVGETINVVVYFDNVSKKVSSEVEIFINK